LLYRGTPVADHAHSDDPAVQAQLDRFAQLSPGRDILGLERIVALLDLIGNPHLKLPPVFHIAGTNGKGSTCAFLRAAIEAAGMTAHVYTSPHLCRFNERIRVAGKLITDEALAPLLADVLDAAEAADLGPSFFEATTAAAFLAFSRTPADAAIIEVGLGGRLDATNAIQKPAVCGIAQLGIDHEGFLLAPEDGAPSDPLERIAFEKAGIAKTGVPLVTMAYAPNVAAQIEQVAAKRCCAFHPKGSVWDAVTYNGSLHYQDMSGKLKLPLPTLPGGHQAMNAALAVAMIRHQSAVKVPEAALRAAMGWAHWPARLQRLAPGPLVGDREVWLDGGHNEAAGATIAAFMKDLGAPFHLITGMLANKDARGLLSHFKGPTTRFTAVPVPGHPCHPPEELAAIARDLGMDADTAEDVTDALARSTAPVTLFLVSLYLSGEVLRANDQLPD
jgi:dihydrofolate synthase / folylpolyglutamate synthase